MVPEPPRWWMLYAVVKEAMKAAIRGVDDVEELLKISAGNYGGKLGKYKIYLRELSP